MRENGSQAVKTMILSLQIFKILNFAKFQIKKDLPLMLKFKKKTKILYNAQIYENLKHFKKSRSNISNNAALQMVETKTAIYAN